MTAPTFEFRLQRLLETKERQEQVLEIEVARLERSIAECLAAQERWRRVREEAIEALREARRRADLDLNARYAAYLPRVHAQVRRCAAEAAALREERARVQARLLEVMQSRQVLEKYRDRLLREFAGRLEAAEERATDAHAIRTFFEAAPREAGLRGA